MSHGCPGFGWLFAQGACAFGFARGGRDDLPAFGFEAFELRVHSGKHHVHVVAALGGVLRAEAVNLFKDFARFHSR